MNKYGALFIVVGCVLTIALWYHVNHHTMLWVPKRAVTRKPLLRDHYTFTKTSLVMDSEHTFFIANMDLNEHASGWMLQWVRNKEHPVQRVVYESLNLNAHNAWMIDVGANTGYYGLYAASMGYHVVWVEPQYDCVDLIRGALSINTFPSHAQHIVMEMALSDQDRTFSMTSNGLCSNGYLEPENPTVKTTTTHEVHAKRGDTLLSPHIQSTPIQLIKVDVEGFEVHTLVGLKTLLAQTQTLIFEYSPFYWTRADTDHNEGLLQLVSVYADCGFTHAYFARQPDQRVTDTEQVFSMLQHQSEQINVVFQR